MPVDATHWKTVVRCREFWLGYYSLMFETSGLDDRTWRSLEAIRALVDGREIRLPLPDGYALAVAFGEEGTNHRLHLRKGRRRQLLGWDSSHFYPYVFRWSEFLRIVEAATEHPEAPLPRWAVVLLLFAYVGLTPADDLKAVARTFREALEEGKFSPAAEVRRFVDPIARRDWGEDDVPTWELDPSHGWIYRGDYSLRTVDGDYPFDLKAFRRFIRPYK